MTAMLIADSNFLVPNGTFIVVLIAFILVLGFIAKLVVPPLNRVLTERQDQIRGELEAADKAKADAEEADAERRAVLDRARGQAREIVAQASTAADQMKVKAEADGSGHPRPHRAGRRRRGGHRPAGGGRGGDRPGGRDRARRRRAGHRA
jgi:hypothetical protein